MSLIGPGTVDQVVERHYAESLRALPLLDQRDGTPPSTLVDLGSGAGFPGFALAAARPGLRAVLVDSQSRKVSFLRHAVGKVAARYPALSCQCLDARVGARLPAEFPRRVDLVTIRAVRLTPELWQGAAACLAPGGRLLCWRGPATVSLGPGWTEARRIRIEGTGRAIVEILRQPAENESP